MEGVGSVEVDLEAVSFPDDLADFPWEGDLPSVSGETFEVL